MIHPEEPGYCSDVSVDWDYWKEEGKAMKKVKEKKAAKMAGGDTEMGDAEEHLAQDINGLKIAEPEPMDES